jgi:cathepsin C
MKCGHEEPSREDTSFNAKPNLSWKEEFEITLFSDDKAEMVKLGENQTGKWTMVYDEGFDIEFENRSFFAFSKYIIEKDDKEGVFKHKSLCYSTCVGWYKNKQNTMWGCYKAYKTDTNKDEIVYFNTKPIEDSKNENRLDLSNNRKNIVEKMRFKMISNSISSRQLQKNNYLDFLKNVKKDWNMEFYPEFLNKTNFELNQLAGMARNTKNKHKDNFLFRFKNVNFKERQLLDTIKKY